MTAPAARADSIPRALRALLRNALADRIVIAADIADDPTVAPHVRLDALRLLAQYGLGPPQSGALAGDDSADRAHLHAVIVLPALATLSPAAYTAPAAPARTLPAPQRVHAPHTLANARHLLGDLATTPERAELARDMRAMVSSTMRTPGETSGTVSAAETLDARECEPPQCAEEHAPAPHAIASPA